jgi:antitoxin (DNA-binding transcriptional repressor) of toxin-antitoxin stability system
MSAAGAPLHGPENPHGGAQRCDTSDRGDPTATIAPTRHITQRELHNDNDTPAVMRAIEAGESFVLTRNGTPQPS